MRSIYAICVMAIFFVGCTAEQLKQASQQLGGILEDDKLTADQVASGLKEALIKGTSTGANQASKVDGYFKNPQLKIPFPPDVKKVETKLRQIGLGNQVDKFVLTLNRGAEEAAKEAAPIFVSAIKGMTVQDAWGILKGDDNAATNYLKRQTSNQLRGSFKPVIKRALDKTQATKYYSDVINTYNKIPFVDQVNPNLDDYATQKAIDGLFILIAKEEKNIRENPIARTTELLKKVFSQQ
ncbi:MAG: DUF4197 domain-containing protein [bacterium]|nr:DUF4197 domain-containing protein [bacterium]